MTAKPFEDPLWFVNPLQPSAFPCPHPNRPQDTLLIYHGSRKLRVPNQTRQSVVSLCIYLIWHSCGVMRTSVLKASVSRNGRGAWHRDSNISSWLDIYLLCKTTTGRMEYMFKPAGLKWRGSDTYLRTWPTAAPLVAQWVRMLCLGSDGCQFKSHAQQTDFTVSHLNKALNP